MAKKPGNGSEDRFKEVDIITYKGKKYLIDFNKMQLYSFDYPSSLRRLKAALRNPKLAPRMKRPSNKHMEALVKNSKVYDPDIHKFEDE